MVLPPQKPLLKTQTDLWDLGCFKKAEIKVKNLLIEKCSEIRSILQITVLFVQVAGLDGFQLIFAAVLFRQLNRILAVLLQVCLTNKYMEKVGITVVNPTELHTSKLLSII